MADQKYLIFVHTIGEFVEHVVGENTASEDICVIISKSLNISPAARHLFGIRCCASSAFVPGCRSLEPANKYEFRLRFVVPVFSKLKKLDPVAYNYFYHQVKTDLISSKIGELVYPHHKEKVLGLCVTNMYIEMLEDRVAVSHFDTHFKKYVPKLHIKNQPRSLKSKILHRLRSFKNMDHDSFYVKGTFLDSVNILAPNYFVERYLVVAPYPQEDDLRQGGTCPAEVEFSPYNAERPGLSVYYKSKKLWKHITTIDNIYAIIIDGDSIKIEMRDSPNGLVIKMPDNAKLLSLASCLAGYYRLMVKWTVEICAQLKLHSLSELRALRCHGPVGGQYSYAKLQQINVEGANIVRQCETQYDVYYIDIITKTTTVGIETYKVKRDLATWSLYQDGNVTSYETLTAVAKALADKPNIKHVRLSPSDNDQSPVLLLCRPLTHETGKRQLSVDSQAEMRQANARIFNPTTDLRKYLNTSVLCENGKFTEMRADWLLPNDQKLEVTLRILNKTSDLSQFLQLHEKWRLLSLPELVKVYGVTLSAPYTMVTESLQLGPLDSFLQEHRNVSLVAIIDAAHSLARALHYLHENKIFHGRVRCRALKVFRYEAPNELVVRLSDPGLTTTYSKADAPWIAPEYRNHYNGLIEDRRAEVYAYATTFWEMLSRGKPIYKTDYRAKRDVLRQPNGCPIEIYNLLLKGWSAVPDFRFTIHEIFPILRLEKSRHSCSYSSLGLSQITISETNSETSDQTDDTLISEHSSCDSGGSSQFILTGSGGELQYDNLYNNAIEIDGGKVVFEECVGKGNYGTVYRGKLLGDNDRHIQNLAIKTLNPQMDNKNVFNDFEREINIMGKLNHKNIVKILTSLTDPQIMIIMEYIEQGSFINYVSIKRDSLSPFRLLHFAKDIADGMQYLVSMKIVHRDLAARNILIDSDNVVKISDFGLAQVTTDSGYYTITNKSRSVPIKWYAPETLRTEKYSFQSDVWSFGVTMFEMFSHGENPNLRKGRELTLHELIELFDKGDRLPCPELCPRNVYNTLMWPCWLMEPKERPTFNQLFNDIQALISQYSIENKKII